MADILKFDRHRPPILHVELMDDRRTVIRVTPPTVELQEELRARQSELSALLADADDDNDTREMLYNLAARLLSCNRNMRKFTPEQLLTTYGLDEEDLVVFFHAYTDFLTKLERAKN